MERNEILKNAQKNTTRGKEYENKESIKSYLVSFLVSLMVGTILLIFELLLKGRLNLCLITVFMVAASVQQMYESIKNQKKYGLIIGGVESLLAVIFLFAAIVQVTVI